MDSIYIARALQHREEMVREVEDAVVVEEPLEIRVNGRPFSATMRTPQSEETDRFLTLGLLLAEGVIASYDDVSEVKINARCRDFNGDLSNVADVILFEDIQTNTHKWARGIISNSSCGLCGHASIEALSSQIESLVPVPLNVELLRRLPEQMRKQQIIFSETGGLHAAAIFDASGNLLACFEDIGRHNATDKAVGFCLQNDLLFNQEGLILLISGRASFEIIQKALRAQIGTVAAVSAASSLAVGLAQRNGLNLVGFLRERGLTIYTP